MTDSAASSTPLGRVFAKAKQEGRAALVTYLMAGDPDVAGSVALAEAAIDGGAEIIELGMPFSDPIADGPTLQEAAARSLAAGTTTAKVFEIAEKLHASRPDVPLVLMGYLNPILAFGEDRFARRCSECGVEAVLIPDLPPDEAFSLSGLLRARKVSLAFLLAPTSTPRRRARAFAAGSGFIYFVSVTGVTGARKSLPPELGDDLDLLRRQSPLPVIVGFGISTPDQAEEAGRFADGVVVGSAVVQRIAQAGTLRERTARVRLFVRSLAEGLTRGGGRDATSLDETAPTPDEVAAEAAR